MKALRPIALIVSLAISVLAISQQPGTSSAFIENKGQWDAAARFVSRLPGVDLWITADGAVMDFHQFKRTNHRNPNSRFDHAEGITTGQVVRVSFENACAAAPIGIRTQRAYYNYLTDKYSIKHVRLFDEARAPNIYEGISARYYVDHGAPRYDLVVKPGADPSQISLRIDGADAISVSPQGDLRIETCLGTVEEKGLTVYQGEGGDRRQIPASLAVDGNHLRFKVGAFDPSQPLVIDPVVYSSYFGGAGGTGTGDQATCVTSSFLSAGLYYQYVAGTAQLLQFPVTQGSYQTTLQQGVQGFVAQTKSDGPVTWCTFIQGTSLNSMAQLQLNAAVLDGYNNVIVGGAVENESYPITFGAYYFEPVNNTATNAGFISKISEDGTQLLESSLVNPNYGTEILGMATDPSGDIMFVGRTSATNYPCTSNALQTANHTDSGGTGITSFVSELSPDFTTLKASTYLGGSSEDVATCITSFGSNGFMVGGYTSSADFPVVYASINNTYISTGNYTGFVAALSNDCTQIIAATYFGGSTQDQINALFLDPSSGDVVVAGSTMSPDLPAYGSYQPALSGEQNGFIAYLQTDLDTNDGCSYFGGSGVDSINAICSDQNGGFYVAGSTDSTNLPVTSNCYQNSGGGSAETAFVADFPGYTSVNYCTYYGSGTAALALATDPLKNAVIAGSAGYVPTTPNATQNMNNASGNATNAFYACISPLPESMILSAPGTLQVAGKVYDGSVTLSSVVNEGGGTVTLASDNPALSVQADCYVGPNAAYGAFTLVASPVSAKTTAHVTASYNGLTSTIPVNLVPSSIKSVTFNKPTVTGGGIVTGTVTLTGPAGAAPMTVNLQSADPAAAKVSATMTILAKATSGTFTVTTSPVNGAAAVKITATNGGGSDSGTVTVDPPTVSSLSFSPATVQGGVASSGKVMLNGNAGASGVTVNLIRHNTAIQIPVSVVVPAGKNSATFTITTTPVNINLAVEITAQTGSVLDSSDIELEAASLSSVSLTPASIAGATKVQGTVQLNSVAGSDGATVSLSSANTALAIAPASVKVAANASSAIFAVSALQVTANASVTLSAKLGTVTKSATLTLVPVELSSFNVAPLILTGGAACAGSITLTGPVGADQVFVSLASNAPAAAIPQYSLLDFGTAGQKTQSFSITTYPVASPTIVTFTAKCNGISKTQQLTVNPAALSNIVVNPASVVGGTRTTVTIYLTGPAGPSPVVVSLQSSNSLVTMPGAMTIPVGQSRDSFFVKTSALKASTRVTLTAQWNILTKTTTLTLTP